MKLLQLVLGSVALSALISSVAFSAPAPKGKTLEQRVGALEGDVDELNERMDENELSAALSKVKFGLDFNTSVNNVTAKSGSATTKYNNRWIMGLYLNMNADVNKYTKFTGRLSMTKAFGDLEWVAGASGISTTNAIGSLDAGRGISGGAAVYVERAYVDIYMGEHFALTLGRLPGTDGPGSNLRNSSARMSTYPAMAVNALGDGAVLTYKPYTNGALRIGYSKIYQPMAMGLAGGNGGAGNILATSNASDANLFFAAFETPFLPRSFGDNLFMLTYINLQDYTIPGDSIAAAARLQGQATATATDQNAGNMQYVNAHFENDRFLGSGLHWFISYSFYRGSDAQSISATTTTTPPTTTIPLNATYALFANQNASAVHAGLRYDFGEHFRLGYEYFYGSKYWYAFSRVSINDPFNFRNTRGNVHDVYAIWQVDLNQFFRLSWTLQTLKFGTPSTPGVTAAVDSQTNQNIALAYILRF